MGIAVLRPLTTLANEIDRSGLFPPPVVLARSRGPKSHGMTSELDRTRRLGALASETGTNLGGFVPSRFVRSAVYSSAITSKRTMLPRSSFSVAAKNQRPSVVARRYSP